MSRSNKIAKFLIMLHTRAHGPGVYIGKLSRTDRRNRANFSAFASSPLKNIGDFTFLVFCMCPLSLFYFFTDSKYNTLKK